MLVQASEHTGCGAGRAFQPQLFGTGIHPKIRFHQTLPRQKRRIASRPGLEAPDVVGDHVVQVAPAVSTRNAQLAEKAQIKNTRIIIERLILGERVTMARGNLPATVVLEACSGGGFDFMQGRYMGHRVHLREAPTQRNAAAQCAESAERERAPSRPKTDFSRHCAVIQFMAYAALAAGLFVVGMIP